MIKYIIQSILLMGFLIWVVFGGGIFVSNGADIKKPYKKIIFCIMCGPIVWTGIFVSYLSEKIMNWLRE